MLCLGGVCVPYTAVVPLILLVVRWGLAKLYAIGLVPEYVADLLNLKQLQSQQNSSSCCSPGDEKNNKTIVNDAVGPSVVQELESEEAFATLLQEGGRVCLKFTASWCAPCKKIQPKYEALSSQYAETAKFLTVDVDEFDAIASKYSVAMMPTFLVCSSDQVLGTLRGSNEAELETFLKEHLS